MYKRQAVLVLDARRALRHLLHQAVERAQDLQRLEARDNARHVIFLGEELEDLRARDDGNVTRKDEAVYADIGVIEQRTQCRRHELLG